MIKQLKKILQSRYDMQFEVKIETKRAHENLNNPQIVDGRWTLKKFFRCSSSATTIITVPFLDIN